MNEAQPNGTIVADYDSGVVLELHMPFDKAVAYDIGSLLWFNGLPYKVTGHTIRTQGDSTVHVRPARELPAWVESEERYG